MKKAVISLNGAISKSDYSHRSSWVKMRMHQEGEDWDFQPPVEDLDHYDEIIIYLGMEWKGALNLFGGEKSPLIDYARYLLKRNPATIKWLDINPGSYDDDNMYAVEGFYQVAEGLQKRTGEDFSGLLEINTVMKQPNYDKIVIGDSHAVSQYRPGWQVFRNDFKTLHGALQLGLYENLFKWFHPKELCFYFGNIDIRHHLMRMVDPEKATEDLVIAYVEMIKRIKARNPQLEKVEVVVPLPIESENRAIPKSGFYKGSPFFGTWAERNYIRNIFINVLENDLNDSFMKLYYWPKAFSLSSFHNVPELNQEYMEKPRSVHLAWKYGRFMRGDY